MAGRRSCSQPSLNTWLDKGGDVCKHGYVLNVDVVHVFVKRGWGFTEPTFNIRPSRINE